MTKPVPCNSTLEFRCHPERDNNNRQEDHQNCAHDMPCLFFRAPGGRQKTPNAIPEFLHDLSNLISSRVLFL
jgi:hypothetical protein